MTPTAANIVPTDSASVFAALNTLVLNSASLAIVRPNNPPPGIAGFVLDVTQDDGVELESNITDYYVEENTPVQDQIALQPEVVTVTGKVAELVLAAVTPQRVVTRANPLPLIPGLLPQLAPGAQAAQTATLVAASNTEAAVESAQTLYGYYQSRAPQQPNQTKQSMVFGYFYQLWLGRQRMLVETPYGFFTNMAIQSISAKQGPENRVVTDFSITFKKIRTVQALSLTAGLIPGWQGFFSDGSQAGRAAPQAAPVTQNGLAGLLQATKSQREDFVRPPPTPQ